MESPATAGPGAPTGADLETTAFTSQAMPRCCVENLGCRVNRTESDWMEEGLSRLGCPLVPRDRAQVVVINTCAVTGEAQGKTRKAVRRACEEPGVDLVAVTGCVVSLFPDEMLAISPKVRVLPAKLDVARDVTALWSSLRSDAEAPAAASGTGAAGEWDGPTPAGDDALFEPSDAGEENLNTDDEGRAQSDSSRHLLTRLRRGIKVQDGCDCRCTYCIVWKARGKSRSVPLEQIDHQIDLVLEEGACEVDLTGVNLGTFSLAGTAHAGEPAHAVGTPGGAPAEAGDQGLAALVSHVAARLEGRALLRASSLEPQDVTLDVLHAMARRPGVVCPHLHLPLQSGCDRTLRRMGRPYLSADFERIARHARQTVPGFSLTTDVIVGFPGETDEEFEESLAFCSTMEFSRMHVFRYSERPGTPAADMPGKVDPAVARDRSEQMRALARRMRLKDAASRVGTREPALVERAGGPGEPGRGTTASYHDVLVSDLSGSSIAPGLHTVEVDRVRADGVLLAHVVGYVRLVGSSSR